MTHLIPALARESLGARSIDTIAMDPDRIYIGRWHDGPFGNPFMPGLNGTTAQVVARFRRYLQKSASLREMPGKILVCHCRPGRPCHGDVYIELTTYGELK